MSTTRESSLSRSQTATERLSPAVWALFDSLEGRLTASEDRGRAVADELASVRSALTNAQHRVDELTFLQDGLEVRINDLGADKPPSGGRRGHEPCPLSAREVEVLAHLAQGKVYKQIALGDVGQPEHGAQPSAQRVRQARHGRSRPGRAARKLARLAVGRSPDGPPHPRARRPGFGFGFRREPRCHSRPPEEAPCKTDPMTSHNPA